MTDPLPEMPETFELNSDDVAARRRADFKRLFPEVFNDDKLDVDELRRVLGDWVDEGIERFGLTWPGKAACMKVIQAPAGGALRPERNESLEFDRSDNIFIEGDNLEVLKLLQKAYFGKVKMIYIDPPYNTGKEFIYPDKYAENIDTYLAYTGQIDADGQKFSTNTEASGRFHSRWLNMMYPRLLLAKNLLRDDGAIFINIDATEMHNLRSICDRIFGEENFVNEFIWQKNSSGKTVSREFPVNIDHILLYSKSSAFKLNVVYKPLSEATVAMYNKDDQDGRGKYRFFPMQKTKSPGPETTYDYEDDHGRIWPCPEKGWRMVKDKVKLLERDGRIDLTGNTLQEKAYWNERESDGKFADTLWDDISENHVGTAELKKLFGKEIFDNPKPTALLERCISIGSEENDLILDFFAGSASTAHAVAKMATSNKGERRFILVQLPEPVPADSEAAKMGLESLSAISKERIRRAHKQTGYKGGFRAFSLSRSNFSSWSADTDVNEGDLLDRIDAHADHLVGANDESVLYEILLKDGFELTTKVEVVSLENSSVYCVADGALLICLERDLTKELIDALADLAEQKDAARVVCLDAGFQHNDQLKTNAVQTFKSRLGHGEDGSVFRTV